MRRIAAAVALGLALAAGMFALGRATTGEPERGYADGFRDGRAVGVQEGRALQVGQLGPSGSQDAFNLGYAAGANDAFGGYDGGWSRSVPYLVVLGPGEGAITYRIVSRTELRPGTAYFLCPDSSAVCSEARP
jgi:hypothetical protein